MRNNNYFYFRFNMDIVKNSFLLPTMKLDDQKFEFIFLIDNSGSMAGEPMELAKRALTLILHSLPSTCYFNIVVFTHDFYTVFPVSVAYNQSNLEYAKIAVAGIQATGGTNILGPLQHIYQQPQIPGYLTQIFSITDGCVSDRETVLQLVASKVKHSRSFSLGIGDNVDRALVIGIAENAGGMHEFVTQGERIESKVLNQLKIAQKPALLKPIRVVQKVLDGNY